MKFLAKGQSRRFETKEEKERERNEGYIGGWE